MLPQLLTTALRTETGTTLVIGVELRHYLNGLLPSPVASSKLTKSHGRLQVPSGFAPSEGRVDR